MNQKVNCLLCNETSKLIKENYPGYQEPQTFNIYYCSYCNTSFSLPRIETNDLYDFIYKNTDKLPGYNRYWKYANDVKNSQNPFQYLSESEEMYWAIKSVLTGLEIPKDKLRVIEIGCGLGYLTYSLIKEGYCAMGLDISQNAINEAIKNYGNNYICADVMEYADKNKKTFDVVILTEVIEHIEEPVAFLKSITDLLTERGLIILTTPNKTIFPASTVWRTDLPPVHLWWFSEKSIKYIANEINTNVEFVDYTKYYKNKPGYCNVKRQKIKEQKHIFTSNWEIIGDYTTLQTEEKKPAKKNKLPFFKRIVNIFDPKRYVVYGKRGSILGVVLTQKK